VEIEKGLKVLADLELLSDSYFTVHYMNTNSDVLNSIVSIENEVVARNPDGTFAKGTRSYAGSNSPAKKVAAWFRDQLAKIDPEDKEGRTKMDVLFSNMYAVATNTDPKARKEAVWAFNALLDRAFGPPLKDQAELDALAASGKVFILCQEPVINVDAPKQIGEPQPVFDESPTE
jgi:hypothetical protein